MWLASNIQPVQIKYTSILYCVFVQVNLSMKFFRFALKKILFEISIPCFWCSVKQFMKREFFNQSERRISPRSSVCWGNSLQISSYECKLIRVCQSIIYALAKKCQIFSSFFPHTFSRRSVLKVLQRISWNVSNWNRDPCQTLSWDFLTLASLNSKSRLPSK